MLLEALFFVGEEYETLIHVNHPSVAFQVSPACWATYLSKLYVPNVSFIFLLFFPLVIFSAEKNSSSNASNNPCMLFTICILVALRPSKRSNCNISSHSSLAQPNDKLRGRQTKLRCSR